MKLAREKVMIAGGMKARGVSVHQWMDQLDATEEAFGYRRKKLEREAPGAAIRHDSMLYRTRFLGQGGSLIMPPSG